MNKLVGIDMALSADFVSALQDIWHAGDCAFPIDQRLPHAQKAQLIEDFGVQELVTANGRSDIANRFVCALPYRVFPRRRKLLLVYL